MPDFIDSFALNMKNKLAKLFFVLFILGSSVYSVDSQQTSSLLAGKILDEKNLPINGVDIQITYKPWNKTRVAMTNKKGYFCVANLPPGGPYTIQFSCNGYGLQTREILSLELGNINDLSLHMRRKNPDDKNDKMAGNSLVANESTTINRSDL